MDLIKSSLVIASCNLGKIKEFRQLLSSCSLKVIGQPEKLQIEETGKTFAENARLKAIAVAGLTGEWSLADDSGLSVRALHGRPGVFSARYARNDEERIQRLLREMEFVEDRYAFFSCALCIASPNQEILLEVEGKCEGAITKEPRGGGGFGYDPIFEVLNKGLTYAEMGREQKHSVSHRGRAFALLEPGIKKLLMIKNSTQK